MTTEQLKERAAKIIQAIYSDPERGADLLIDFAKQYSAHLRFEDKTILAKLQWLWAAQENEKLLAIDALVELANKIVDNYNEPALSKFLAKELALAEQIKSQPIQNDVVLSAKNILKRFHGSDFTLNFDFLELRLGEITGLVGENANGKSTLLRILAGELAPDKGILQYSFLDSNQNMFWPQLKNKIAYVPQELPEWQGSLKENLRFEASLHGIKGKANQDAVNYIILRLGLIPHLNKTWSELSGGFKLRFALAKALVWNAKLLIIDEPLAFLDFKTQLIVLNDLKNLASSLSHPISILLSSQHLHEIEELADQMLFLRGGKLETFRRSSIQSGLNELNLFEVMVKDSLSSFYEKIEEFPYEKIRNNGRVWMISTPNNVSGPELLHFLYTKKIHVTYFRDISQSIKTKFYE